VLGFKLRVHGTLATTKPVLYVSNHTSYLDIPVLGALIPASFVAKSEVADWPFFGPLAKLQQTVFIERKATRTSEQSDGLRAKLEKGQSLILFPEGTSSVGLSALPFKSSLFSIVQGDFPKPVVVQPVSITCTGLDGMPLTRDLRSLYAWYGDMTLLPHLWNVFKMGRFTVDVIFHPPVSPGDFPDRKVLAAYCQSQVGRGIEQCLTGRGLAGPVEMPKLSAPKTTVLTAEKV
jgi:1-acyl-sn-glycerol-3-phosphate acyltransferase